jgi:co-chaperonin GroES (HSP10)
MKIRLLHDPVIVKRLEEDRTSPGGIAILRWCRGV